MRKILLLVLFSACTGILSAQVLSAEHMADSNGGKSSDFEIVTHIYVKNISGSPLEITWQRTEFIPSGWGSAVCDFMCYDEATSTNTLTIETGDSQLLELHFYPKGIQGSGYATLDVFPSSGNPSDGIKLTFKGTALSTGITEKYNGGFSLYPNPITTYLNVEFEKKDKHRVEVYNILGRKILTREVQYDNKMRIPFSNMQRGMYVIMYKAPNGKVVTRTISKK